jgi:pimeloyl-ACP methyl ester carboxylesterase
LKTASLSDNFVNPQIQTGLLLEFITIDNKKYFYRISKRALNKEPVVICIHGSGADSVVWSYQLSRLSRYFKIIIPDLPAHGKSEGSPLDTAEEYARWLDEFSKSLSLDSFYLMGHSFGGAIAQEFARHYAEKLKGLILIGTGPNFRFSKIYKKLYEQGIDLSQKEDIKSFLLSKDVPDSFIRGYEALKKMSNGILHDDLLAAGKFDSTSWLSSVKIPSLVLWGEHDSITPKKLPIKLSDLLPVSEFKIINNSGHVVMIEARDEFNSIAKDFIQQNG